MNMLRQLFRTRPLMMILLVGLIFRLGAVIFSKGYSMHDDHYLIIEAPASWIAGYDYADWKPENNDGRAQGHSLFYVGSQYMVLSLLTSLGMDDPQHKMYVIRLLHALFSLIMILAGYRIAEKIGGRKNALIVGLFLAVFWPMPFLSVRNLIEFVATVPILYASWLVVKHGLDDMRALMLSALICGLAMGIRFQLVFFIAGWGLTYWMMRKWKHGLIYGALAIIGFIISQLGDLVWWDYPLTEITAYVDYNIINATTYFDRPWYQYILTLVGILIPPISLFLLYGMGKVGRRHLILFIPPLVFFLFHSYFPNKQERFIIPVLPYVIILGVIGFREFKDASRFWKSKHGLWRGLKVFFISLNTAALFLLTFTYMKRSRVESMYYLYQQEDFNNLFLEYSHGDGYIHYPKYYSAYWWSAQRLTKSMNAQAWKEKNLSPGSTFPDHKMPNYVLFLDEQDLEQRKEAFASVYGEIEYRTTIRPGNFDRLLHWLNHHNKYEQVEIYRMTGK